MHRQLDDLIVDRLLRHLPLSYQHRLTQTVLNTHLVDDDHFLKLINELDNRSSVLCLIDGLSRVRTDSSRVIHEVDRGALTSWRRNPGTKIIESVKEPLCRN